MKMGRKEPPHVRFLRTIQRGVGVGCGIPYCDIRSRIKKYGGITTDSDVRAFWQRFLALPGARDVARNRKNEDGRTRIWCLGPPCDCGRQSTTPPRSPGRPPKSKDEDRKLVHSLRNELAKKDRETDKLKRKRALPQDANPQTWEFITSGGTYPPKVIECALLLRASGVGQRKTGELLRELLRILCNTDLPTPSISTVAPWDALAAPLTQRAVLECLSSLQPEATALGHDIGNGSRGKQGHDVTAVSISVPDPEQEGCTISLMLDADVGIRGTGAIKSDVLGECQELVGTYGLPPTAVRRHGPRCKLLCRRKGLRNGCMRLSEPQAWACG